MVCLTASRSLDDGHSAAAVAAGVTGIDLMTLSVNCLLLLSQSALAVIIVALMI